MARVWRLADPCADPGFLPGVSRPDCQKTAPTTFFFFFCPQLLPFYSGLLMVYFKENYNFTRFGGWGRVYNIFQEGPTFSRGVKVFPGGWGVQILILETHRTCDFPEVGCEPSIPLPSGSAYVTI